MTFLKQKLKQILINKCHRIYEKEVFDKDLSYDRWIREQEKNVESREEKTDKIDNNLTNDLRMEEYARDKKENDGKNAEYSKNCRLVKADGKKMLLVNCQVFFENISKILEKTEADILLLMFYEGQVSEIGFKLIGRQFSENEDAVLVYGDEDVLEDGERMNPWFKPDWSPDRFLASFYFGGLVAVRTTAAQAVYAGFAGEEAAPFAFLWELLKRYHAFEPGHEDGRMPVRHIRQVLYHSKKEGYGQIKDWKLPSAATKEMKGKLPPLISIVIPSKDNTEVLFQCMDSLIERTRTRHPVELILVDNGSREENRQKVDKKVSGLKGSGLFSCQYLYEPMPFNFSRMCNKGAQAAQGEILLFLNDDMEIIQPDWLDLMAEKAQLSYVGAVGAKLLYPDSSKIQHAGITNLRVGPAHKLQFLDDKEVHYFGMNRGVHNMLAATGACLMMQKAVFKQAGGFYEGLAVAFNDVDLCYSIYEKGYYNVVRNDVTLYHHESLSRGNDGESEEKQLRLLREKDILYERHQKLYGHDPFYHPYLTTDMLESKYAPAYHYQVTLDMPWSEVSPCTKEVMQAREDECLRVGMECAMDIYKWQYGVSPKKGNVKPVPSDMGYYFQGYSFVIGADNACYVKKLLLRNQDSGQIWAVPIENRYRKDIRNNLKDQINVDLTGFAAKLHRDAVPAGVYRFGMLAKDQCSRSKLVNWSNWVLEVTENGE